MSARFRMPLAVLFAAAALAACAGASVKRADTFKARKAMAREMVRRSDWAQAFTLVDGLYREKPRDHEVLALRGVIYREQRLVAEAEADLAESLKIEPNNAYAHSNLGILLDQEGRSGAVEHHRRAKELEPRNAAYVNNLAFSLFAHGKPRDAIPIFHEALRLEPTNARTRNNLGFAYAKAGDFRRAAEQFAMGGAPAEAKNNLGYAYQASSNFAQAFDLYVEALRLDRGLARARQNLVDVAKRLGRPIPADLAGESVPLEPGSREPNALEPSS